MFQENRYNWQRRWCRLLKPGSQKSSLAYSSDETDTALNTSSQTFEFEEIEGTRCLVLLGEADMGKTVALEMAYEATKARFEQEGSKNRAFLANLSLPQTEYGLDKELFEHEELKAWRLGDYELHLFLDSLDEARLRIENIAAILSARLRPYPLERLFLRIACRPPIGRACCKLLWNNYGMNE